MPRKAKIIVFAGLISGGLVLAGAGLALWGVQESPHLDPTKATHSVETAKTPQQAMTHDVLNDLKAEMEHLLKVNRTETEQFVAATQRDLMALRAQLDQHRQHQEAVERALEHLRTSLSVPSGATLPAAEKHDEQPEPADLTREEEEARVNAQLSDQINLLEDIIFAEDSDPSWSQTAQITIDEAFHEAEIPGIEFVGADCRTTLCRLDLTFRGATAPEESFRHLMHFSPWKGKMFVHMEPVESGAIVMYMAREGHELPQFVE